MPWVKINIITFNRDDTMEPIIIIPHFRGWLNDKIWWFVKSEKSSKYD